ncbi:class I SAM-dependent methyltransferase [Polaribacter sp. Hel1_85]|uniref:class I SAM-dependent methyltransferase n=1 Tax=Polaribacter sp. Hel1_85 TaxID=1250005 RepID=UPI00068C6B7A|nr:class I SAM-dependent methyltransferase [Polaribacter sp. Hel1_85]
MEQVYKMNLWGSNNSKFYSGDGSHQPKIVKPYIEVVTSFLKSFKSPISVLDLGCGDFNIGKHFIDFTKNYVAVDIVENLIDYNKNVFNAANLDFLCLDIAKDHLPAADCIIVRQVLQHLSNAEVQKVTEKFINYKYVILTEHLPNGDFTPNKDIISGQGIRIKKQSGINLLKAPFHLKIKGEKQLLTHTLEKNQGIITTIIYNL